LDEADKLLDQQYDGFLQRLDEDLSKPRSEGEQDAREKYMRSKGLWDRYERRVRKIVLSATMTRDISKLTALKLRRPQLVVVQGSEPENVAAAAGADATDEFEMKDAETGAYEIPPTLKEYCVPVGDASEKPLQLLELLRSRVLAPKQPTTTKQTQSKSKATTSDSSESSSDSSSDSESDSDSDSSDDSDSSSSDDSSDSESDDDSSSSDSDDEASSSESSAPTVLIFASSTESANRLSHLLQGLRPDWAAYITTLTKTTNNTTHRPTKPTDPVITISTDRAGRGLDTLSGRRITHVLQYDVPRALTAYVHRVGRTARAGANGEAWTLYSDREARWFVNEIMRASNVRRAGPVERVRFGAGDERLKDRFAEVLAGMRDAVFGGGK
jgi:ATP-dependent RNA helicase DDX51/DBP6